MAEIKCDECGDLSERVVCSDCYKLLEQKIKDLEDEISDKDSEIRDLENQIQNLEK